ncbi:MULTISPECIES: DUF5694 domain-containing protein [Rufibacter]|uniref:TraB/GumN family protein n=1 Tax=Rufibacter quisquiliarum TaxID=1549639 RepID=A0A839GH77_9BACT|nr:MULTISPECIES: DUF5694 domain-containing protein [Rufibacter]MBA9076039.1 hypothetical protein [Rufibacter quisquiliarum]
MRLKTVLSLLAFGFTLHTFAQAGKTKITVMASDHLAQIYRKDKPTTDVLTPQGQKAMQDLTNLAAKFAPDMILVEVLPERQREIDSLYALYLQDQLNLETLENGRSEVYQLAFRLGKQLKLKRIVCANAPGGTSQGILANGDNIDLYTQEIAGLRKEVSKLSTGLQNGTLSLKDYTVLLNQPELYNLVYRVRYIVPARVVNGKFKNPDAMVDTAFVNPQYIGAELTSIFKNRDYKIYSNLATAQLKEKPKRMLLLIGAAHIGSLHSILQDDTAFELVPATTFLGKKKQ